MKFFRMEHCAIKPLPSHPMSLLYLSREMNIANRNANWLQFHPYFRCEIGVAWMGIKSKLTPIAILRRAKDAPGTVRAHTII